MATRQRRCPACAQPLLAREKHVCQSVPVMSFAERTKWELEQWRAHRAQDFYTPAAR